MPESRYAKFVITEDLMPPQPAEAVKMMEDQAKAGRTLDRTLLLGIQDSILKGSFFVGCEWLWQLTGNGPVDIEIPHNHDFDEIIGFAGSNKNHPRDLGGELEFRIGDEKLTLTRTCLIFIPRGTIHCPITIKRIDTPIFMFEAGNNSIYEKKL
ncbi:MAG: hypothetical protein NUV31_07730 [Dehalococcoidales bacterium]|jgi:hypothetical protein|nr:hypothetical protein [Dehalococcoidales bacterium]